MTAHLVSEFDAADADELILMWRESFEHAMGIKDPNPLAQQRRYFDEEVCPRTRVQVVKQGGRIIAFVAANERYLAQLYVRVGYSGQGIGSMLLRLAQQQSSGSLSLHTLLRNERACRFYERHGFQWVGRDFEPMWQLESVEYRWSRVTSAV
jgi:ribosomal protein S18 acetylase RimI-like enzyme